MKDLLALQSCGSLVSMRTVYTLNFKHNLHLRCNGAQHNGNTRKLQQAHASRDGQCNTHKMVDPCCATQAARAASLPGRESLKHAYALAHRHLFLAKVRTHCLPPLCLVTGGWGQRKGA